MKPPREQNACRQVQDISWTQWEAVDTATLTFVTRQDEEVLLIRKKRGLGGVQAPCNAF